jgi:hypothetical protein
MDSIQAELDQLERDGLLRKTGELRRARDGTMQPVYVPTPAGRRALGKASKVLPFPPRPCPDD